MRITVNLTQEETKEALKTYSLRYSSRLLRFVEKSALLGGLALCVSFWVGMLTGRPWFWFWIWGGLGLVLCVGGLRIRRVPAWRFPEGNERVILFSDDGISVQNLFGRTIRREKWSNIAPVIETSKLYLMVSPRSLDVTFASFIRRRLYVIPKRVLSDDAVYEFRQLLQHNLRRYPDQITQIAS